jgi:hypothetical protein
VRENVRLPDPNSNRMNLNVKNVRLLQSHDSMTPPPTWVALIHGEERRDARWPNTRQWVTRWSATQRKYDGQVMRQWATQRKHDDR